ncbi:hypothetical protein D3C71_1096190 [compost metagenome]
MPSASTEVCTPPCRTGSGAGCSIAPPAGAGAPDEAAGGAGGGALDAVTPGAGAAGVASGAPAAVGAAKRWIRWEVPAGQGAFCTVSAPLLSVQRNSTTSSAWAVAGSPPGSVATASATASSTRWRGLDGSDGERGGCIEGVRRNLAWEGRIETRAGRQRG